MPQGRGLQVVHSLATQGYCDGWIYFKFCQGCYGLPQAGILANDLVWT